MAGRAGTDEPGRCRCKDNGGHVGHPIAQHLIDMTHLLGELPTRSRDFH